MNITERQTKAVETLRNEYRLARTGTFNESHVIDALLVLSTSDELRIRAAFEAIGCKLVRCPKCQGNGIDPKFYDACGLCCGRRAVSEKSVAQYADHKRGLAEYRAKRRAEGRPV